MKKIKPFLFAILAAVSLSSCTLDSASFGVSAVSYPSYIEARPVRRHQPAIYHTTQYYRYDVRPDWMRYGGNWVPARRYHRR
tara:strand:+ start:227 stop:472 length:246 start_codon:yes stop_codon:yes gene_type:complete